MFVNTLELHAREMLGMPENWVVSKYESIGDSREHFMLTGAIYPIALKSGPRKGRPNYKFKEQEKSVVFSTKEHDAWVLEWEKKNKTCSRCGGEGASARGFDQLGDIFRTCSRCKKGPECGPLNRLTEFEIVVGGEP